MEKIIPLVHFPAKQQLPCRPYLAQPSLSASNFIVITLADLDSSRYSLSFLYFGRKEKKKPVKLLKTRKLRSYDLGHISLSSLPRQRSCYFFPLNKMEGTQIQTPQLNLGTMKPTGSHPLLPRVYYPAGGDVGCSRREGCVTARLPRPPDTTRRLVVRHPPPPPHTPKATLQKGWAPRKTRSLDAPPAASADISGGGCTKPGASPRGAGAPKGSRPGASGRSPWGRGRKGTGGRRPRGAPALPPSASGLARHPAAGRARTPGRRSRGRRRRRRAESRAAPTPSASLTPHHGEGPDREAGRAARPVSLCHAVLPPPRRRCRRRRRRGARAPSVPLGNNVIPHTPHT